MTRREDAAHTALSSFIGAVVAAEKADRGTPALLDQAGGIGHLVRDAGLVDLVPEAADLYRRAMKLRSS